MARDFEGMERRRLQAADMFEQGLSQADVAKRLAVSKQSVSRWQQAWQQGGKEALKSAGRAGRLPRLSAAQLEQLEEALLAGPLAAGYRTELWTLPRIAELIRRRFAVSYHPGHVWWLLRQMGWSCQRPATRANERDEEAIHRWLKQSWPKVKKGRAKAAPA